MGIHVYRFHHQVPKSKGYDSICVIVWYLTKIAYFVPTHMTADALFIENILRLHGIPQVRISDRYPKFSSKFWKSLFKTLETQLRFSIAFHPDSDGQTERMNQILGIMLRHYVDDRPTTWTKYIPIIEFV